MPVRKLPPGRTISPNRRTRENVRKPGTRLERVCWSRPTCRKIVSFEKSDDERDAFVSLTFSGPTVRVGALIKIVFPTRESVRYERVTLRAFGTRI